MSDDSYDHGFRAGVAYERDAWERRGILTSRDRIYDIVLRELETKHPIPTTVLLATRIANALSDTSQLRQDGS